MRLLSRSELRARWHKLFKRPAPVSFSTQKLARAIGYRLQVAHYESEDSLLPRRGRARISSLTDGAGAPLVLRRSWNGRDHEVLKDGDKFLYGGTPYKSLSAVARAITGTRWNGWAFFGLANPAAADRGQAHG